MYILRALSLLNVTIRVSHHIVLKDDRVRENDFSFL